MTKVLFAVAVVLLMTAVVQAAPMSFVADMNGSQVAPTPVATTGTGTFTLTLDSTETLATLGLTFSNLIGAETSAAIFLGAPGTVGTSIAPLPMGSFSGLTVPVDAGQVSTIRSGNLYVQISTDAFPDGEIRGQLLAAAAPVPEPASVALVLGGGALAFALRRRR